MKHQCKKCQHKHLKYCANCDCVFCVDCGLEFLEKQPDAITYPSYFIGDPNNPNIHLS